MQISKTYGSSCCWTVSLSMTELYFWNIGNQKGLLLMSLKTVPRIIYWLVSIIHKLNHSTPEHHVNFPNRWRQWWGKINLKTKDAFVSLRFDSYSQQCIHDQKRPETLSISLSRVPLSADTIIRNKLPCVCLLCSPWLHPHRRWPRKMHPAAQMKRISTLRPDWCK